jgi:hypothetical protein
VDLVGFTFYNRGKATSNRQRLTPTEILFDREWQTYDRLKALGKPLIIDEVGTTAVRYSERYNAERSRVAYLNDTEKKEARLELLKSFLEQHTEILGAIYFNVDYTAGLQFPTVGEADRAIVDTGQGKRYQGFFSLYQHANSSLNQLLSYFMNSTLLRINEQERIVPKSLTKTITTINELVNKKAETSTGKLALVEKLIQLNIKDATIQKSLTLLQEFYAE